MSYYKIIFDREGESAAGDIFYRNQEGIKKRQNKWRIIIAISIVLFLILDPYILAWIESGIIVFAIIGYILGYGYCKLLWDEESDRFEYLNEYRIYKESNVVPDEDSGY